MVDITRRSISQCDHLRSVIKLIHFRSLDESQKSPYHVQTHCTFIENQLGNDKI